jgi:hypothetical protein
MVCNTSLFLYKLAKDFQLKSSGFVGRILSVVFYHC